jgi:hypothetical protein
MSVSRSLFLSVSLHVSFSVSYVYITYIYIFPYAFFMYMKRKQASLFQHRMYLHRIDALHLGFHDHTLLLKKCSRMAQQEELFRTKAMGPFSALAFSGVQ